MLDIKTLRNNPDETEQALARRGDETADAAVAEGLGVDAKRRSALLEVEALKKRRNEASQEVAKRKKAGEDDQKTIPALIEETREAGQQISALDGDIREIEAALESKLLHLPNIPAASTPDGVTEADN